MIPPDRLALAAWYLDALTPYRAAYNVMTPPGHKSKYFARHEELTPALIAEAFDGKRRDRGRGPIWSIAAHRLQLEGRAMCAAIDYDKGGQAVARRALALLGRLGLWGFASLSTSSEGHDGAHVWIPFQSLQDAELLLSVAQRILRDTGGAGEAYPTQAALRLPAMPHLRADGGPRVFPILLPDGELLDGDAWAIVAALKSRWQANADAALWEADSALPPLTVALPALRHKSEVSPTDPTKVIDWYLRTVSIEAALEDIGRPVDGRSHVYLCPFHDDTNPSMGILPHRHLDGVRVARCFAPHCKAHRTYTAFDIFCDGQGLDPSRAEDRRRAVFLIADAYGLGRRRQTRIEETPADPTPTRQPYTLETHNALLAAQRHGLALTLSDVAEDALTAGVDRKRVRIIRAVPGTGKTTAAADTANRATAAGLRVAIVAPNHEHAKREWAERLAEPFIWQPRKALCTCFSAADLDTWGRKGYAAPHCTDSGCPYHGQKYAAEGKQVIFQFAHLGLRGGDLLAGYDMVIVDESPAEALLDETTVTVGELDGLARRDEACAPLCRALIKAANRHGRREAYGPALLDTVRRYCDLDQAVDAAASSYHATPHPPAPVGEHAPAELPRVFLPDLLTALAHDIQYPDRNALLTWGRTPDGWRYVYHRRAAFLAEPWRRLDGPAVILLDGSADPVIYRRLLAPWPIDFTIIGAPASPVVRIIQAPGVASTRRILQDEKQPAIVARHLAEIANTLGVVIDGGITYQKLAPTLAEVIGGDWSLYYGKQRGRNGLEAADVVAVVASPTVPPDAVARKARALWHDDTPIDPTETRVGVGMFRQTDPRLARLARAHGPEELRQAVHRARLVTRTTPTTVIVASPWSLAPLGLPVAATITELTAAQSAASRDALAVYQERRLARTVEIPVILDSPIRKEANNPPHSKNAKKPTSAPVPGNYQPPPPVSGTPPRWASVATVGRSEYRRNLDTGEWQHWHPVKGWQECAAPPAEALARPAAA